MKILVTGANGLLGQYLIRDLAMAGHDIIATGKGNSRLPVYVGITYAYMPLDITNREAVHEMILQTKPSVIIHAAAITQPDACELDKAVCWSTNVHATTYITEAAQQAGSELIYISTDFVFDGDDGPYKEDDKTHPVNYYGKSKLAAEQIVQASTSEWAIVRTVLVYGNILAGTRSNVVTWVKENLENKKNIKVVNDQVRTPTYVEDLSRGVVLIIEKKARGIYHISGKEVFTPYEMALQVADYFGLDKSLMEKVNASVFTQPARRPLKTGFIIDKAEKDLRYKPVTFKEGIRKMYEESGKK